MLCQPFYFQGYGMIRVGFQGCGQGEDLGRRKADAGNTLAWLPIGLIAAANVTAQSKIRTLKATYSSAKGIGVEKGIMTLIDQGRAATLYAAMPPAREISGGSAANTVAGAAAIGAKTGFIGRVRDDQLGRIFAHDIRASGVHYDGPILADGAETSRCLVLVGEDGERSMNTFLGASVGLADCHIAAGDTQQAEGYLQVAESADAAALTDRIRHLRETRGIGYVKLDATPEGQPLYKKLGFLPE